MTYAGGGKSIDDLARVFSLGNGKVGLTFGSALDIFGGAGVRCVLLCVQCDGTGSFLYVQV